MFHCGHRAHIAQIPINHCLDMLFLFLGSSTDHQLR